MSRAQTGSFDGPPSRSISAPPPPPPRVTVARLADSLVSQATLPVETVRMAIARQIVYGGMLDTTLLEMDALDEAAVWNALSRASGLPIPSAALLESVDPDAGALFDTARSARCRAVPVARRGETLQLLCAEPIATSELDEASAELGLGLELYVVPEVRLRAAQQVVYGQPMPPRFLGLLARILGAEPVRKWAASQEAPAIPPAAPDPPDVASPLPPPESAAPPPPDDDDALFKMASGPRDEERTTALRELRRRPETPLARELAAAYREDAASDVPEKALPAIDSLRELRDTRAITGLISLVKAANADVAHAAQHALAEITKQDFGASRRRWTSWWKEHGHEPRLDWLFEGLSHKNAEIRAAAAQELGEICGGGYFGYHFDLPKAEREEARRQWQSWWAENGGARRPG